MKFLRCEIIIKFTLWWVQVRHHHPHHIASFVFRCHRWWRFWDSMRYSLISFYVFTIKLISFSISSQSIRIDLTFGVLFVIYICVGLHSMTGSGWMSIKSKGESDYYSVFLINRAGVDLFEKGFLYFLFVLLCLSENINHYNPSQSQK